MDMISHNFITISSNMVGPGVKKVSMVMDHWIRRGHDKLTGNSTLQQKTGHIWIFILLIVDGNCKAFGVVTLTRHGQVATFTLAYSL